MTADAVLQRSIGLSVKTCRTLGPSQKLERAATGARRAATGRIGPWPFPIQTPSWQLLADAGLPDGIVVHSEGVARVARAGAGLVAEAPIPVDGALVEAAALLHDIDKAEIRRSGGEHGIVGRTAARGGGLRRARDAGRLPPGARLLDDDRFPIGWPSVLVAVADRHVAQEFMTVDERLDDMAAAPSGARRVDRVRPPAGPCPRGASSPRRPGWSVEDLVARLRAAWEAAS